MRSKTLLASCILGTIYAGVLIWFCVSVFNAAGGMDYIDFWKYYFKMLFGIAGAEYAGLITAIVALFITHAVTVVLGALLCWLGYFAKKSAVAKLAATLFLIGTVCFPICILIGIPMIITGFIGGGNQKKLNNQAVPISI